jgi:hypothetical protein
VNKNDWEWALGSLAVRRNPADQPIAEPNLASAAGVLRLDRGKGGFITIGVKPLRIVKPTGAV